MALVHSYYMLHNILLHMLPIKSPNEAVMFDYFLIINISALNICKCTSSYNGQEFS